MVLPVLHSQQALTPGHSQSGQCPGRLEARSEACSALSLKPKQDYLFNFPNTSKLSIQFSSVQSLSRVQLFVTPLWGPKWETLKKEGLALQFRAKMALGGRDEGVA